MSNTRSSEPWRSRIRQEATDWLIRFSEHEVDAAARAEFNNWLCASPEHVRAYLRVSAFWQEAEHIDGRPVPRDIDALVQLARREPNVIPLEPGRETDAPREVVSRVPRRMKFAAVAASVLFATGIGVTTWFAHSRASVYETGIGEQRTVTLKDGSTVVINAGSQLKVAYSDTERGIELREGQALFTVAKNPSRPFIVRSSGVSVRAVGTQFDVNLKDAGPVVTVIEGRVSVARQQRGDGESAAIAQGSAGPEAAQELLLAAGEQALVTAQSVRKQSLAQAQTATAWTQGLLVFDGAPLSEVIHEFNRHNPKPLVVTSDDLLQLKVSGTFPAAGAERILRFLEQRFDVTVSETSDAIRISRVDAPP